MAADDAFDNDAPILASGAAGAFARTADAIAFVESEWYRAIARRGRHMDLIGDYAGSERFVLDGEALLQRVLDDPLLALGRDDDPSFQLLHALYNLEKCLQDMIRREAVFDIVFFDDMRHPTLAGGRSRYTAASRGLARAALFNHLIAHKDATGLAVHVFASLDDAEWQAYCRRTRPMFVMTNDGGADDGLKGLEEDAFLVQRMFVTRLLVTEGIAVTLLKGAEFIDLKIFSFVYEPRYNPNAKIPPSLLEATAASLRSLAETQIEGVPHNLALGLEFEEPDSPVNVLEDAVANLMAGDLDDLDKQLLFVFVLHGVLLSQMGIEQRARNIDALHEGLSKYLKDSFLPRVFDAVTNVLLETRETFDCDGRVFVALVHFIVDNEHEELQHILGDDVYAQAAAIWHSAGAPSPPPSPSFSTKYPNPPAEISTQPASSAPAYQLIPFHNAVFDAELESVRVDVAPDSTPAPPPLEFNQGQIFEDSRHWHAHRKTILPKHQGGEAEQPATAWLRMKRLRRDQRFMASMHQLAATLTGAAGGNLARIVIPPVGNRSRPAPKTIKAPQQAPQKQPKAGKAAKLSSADKIRAQKAEGDRAKADSAADAWWREQRAKLAALGGTAERVELLERLARNERTRGGWLAVEFGLFRLDLELVAWLAEETPDADAVRDKYTVSLLRRVKELYAIVHEHPAAQPVLRDVLTALGFEGLIATLDAEVKAPAVASGDARPLSFKVTKLMRSKSGKPAHKFMAITEHPTVWQLRLFGEFMDRSMDSRADARVTFRPDAWQQRVLDCIDRENCSLLVVAPTSAGKTFISFYAMEKILRESDNGIIVYVSPTKALVNQTAAEIYARFSKDLPSGACWAIHTRDYRIHDPQKCQILVTVPEMLAIMLLSPPLARVWTPRIKRIILDEIHTIGQHEGGSIWEQILLLAPCPIIGLSATVGEPEAFNDWLKSVQTAKGYDHELVLHPHRYSHLRKFAYFPQLLDGRNLKFTGLDKPTQTGVMSFIHPLTALSFGTASMPADLSLEASDTLSTYHAFLKVSEDFPELDVSQLDPVAFFDPSKLLTQRDVLRYEAALKSALQPVLDTSSVNDPDSALRRIVDSLSEPKLFAESVDTLNAPPRDHLLRSNLIYLLSDLKAQGDLPALLFNFDRNDCERMARSICETLEGAEEKWRADSPEWKRKLERVRVWQAGERERQRRAEKLRDAKKKATAEEDARTADDKAWEATFDPERPSEQFSFVGSTVAFSMDDLDKELESLRWTSVPEWAYGCLRRGIAVHHSGMNKAYRNLVERLFRLRFLQVVIATGTLALGINAPTRTAAFCGDSPFLTALMYRQCAGRAGRRGFDTLGRVVFYGLAMDRIHRLMLSKLPRLTGTFPLSSTLTLRLFNLLHGSQDSEYARTAIGSILRLPQISFGSDVGHTQLLHHVRFSIDYLRRTQLLDPDGQPVNLFGVASHLFYTEPSNLALVVLLQSGVLHKLCAPGGVKAQRDVMLLLAHLFGRRPLPPAFTSQDHLAELRGKYPSTIVLPPLQAIAKQTLQAHQREILQVFTAYAVTFAEQHDTSLGLDNTLPLSQQTFVSPKEKTPFSSHLAASALRPFARSLFVANSGHVDRFDTTAELANTVRKGLHLNEHAIPTMDTFLLQDAQSQKMNAYLYDFFVHGQSETLVTANSIRPGDRWFLLSDFDMTLKAIRGDLENLIQHGAKAKSEQDAETDVDSGYQTPDAAEADEEDDDWAKNGVSTRPSGVSDRDWRVLETFNEVVKIFDENFRAMWA